MTRDPEGLATAPRRRSPAPAPMCDAAALAATVGNHAFATAVAGGRVARSTTPPAEARAEAWDAQRLLGKRSQAWLGAYRAFLSENLQEIAAYTGESPGLGWTSRRVADTIAAAAARTATGPASRAVGAAAGALIGTPLAPGVGTAIGAVVGFALRTTAAEIAEALTGKTAASEAAAAARVGAHHDLRAVREGLEPRFGELERRAERLLDGYGDRIGDADEDAGALWRIREELLAELDAVPEPPAKSLALADAVLRDWVLEHAADADDAAAGTDEATWETARDRAFGPGALQVPETFAHQTRAHWRAVGLPDAGITAAMVAAVEARNGDAAAPAEAARREFDGTTWRWSSLGGALAGFRFATFVEAEAGEDDAWVGDPEVVCTLRLETSGGTCHVDAWDYDVRWEREPGVAGQLLGATSQFSSFSFSAGPG